MKLTTRTRYAVRAMFDIAFHSRGQTTQARDIARRQQVPLRYLEQIFQDLKRARLVEGKRGPRGGYSLAKPAEEITVGDVVRAMQGPIEFLAGRAREGELPTSIWRELAEKIDACFDDVRLSDLVRRGESLGLPRGGQPAEPHMYFI